MNLRPGRRPISRLRLAVQLLSFALLIYGGFAIRWLQGSATPLDQPVAKQAIAQGGFKWVERKTTSTQLYLPATVCIYQRQGLCKGCGLYFLSDALTWQPTIEVFLPFLLILLLAMLLAGRLWCGWVCPLGLLSDLLTKIRTALHLERIHLSRGWRDGLVYTKYLLLFLALAIAAWAAFPGMAEEKMDLSDPFCRVCPARIFTAFFSFDTVCWVDWKNSITSSFSVLGLIAFAIFFMGLTIRRFWCRLCPVGGITAVFNRTGLVSIVKNGKKCTHCGTCARVCPLDIREVYEKRGQEVVTTCECSLCLRCVESCPEPGCLKLSWLGKTITSS